MGGHGHFSHKKRPAPGGTGALRCPTNHVENRTENVKKTQKPRRNRAEDQKTAPKTGKETQNALNNRTFFRMVEHVERLFYSTGQTASQLGTSLQTVRLLCENGVIDAETTPGGQWRIPASEVERIQREGLPPIPRPLPVEVVQAEATPAHPPAERNLSDVVASAENLVAITRSTLEKRKIDREIEENEEWFRERERQRAAAAEQERQKAEAKMAEQRHRQWIQQWTKVGLDSMPYDARDELSIEVHTAVANALSPLQADQSDTVTRRLVDAAVHRVLRPWQRKQDLQRAYKSAMSGLPWDIQSKSEWEPVKQVASNAAKEALGKLPEEASDREMAAVAVQAVQPVIRVYEHYKACERVAAYVYVSDATSEEREAAKQSVLKTLLKLPAGTAPGELDKAKEAAIAPYKAAVVQRKEAARLASEKQAQRQAAVWRAEQHLGHIERYVNQEYEFDGGYTVLLQEVNRLRPIIREALIETLLENPQTSDAEIRSQIEEMVDED